MASALEAPPAAERDRAGASGPAPTRSAGVTGLGVALPAGVVSNDAVAERLGVDGAWIARRTGIRARRRAEPGARLSDLAAEAGAAALADAGLRAAQLDLVLVATLSQDEIIPNAAPLVAHALGATAAGAFDVGAACTGFVAALDVAGGLIEAGRAEHVLVVGAELLSRHVDPEDRATAAVFGDGAGAVVLCAGAPGRLGPVVLGADGAGAALIRAPRADGRLRMAGHETFGEAVTHLAEATRAACGAEGLALSDLDLVVLHQANARILTAVAARLGLDPARVVDAIAEVGNTSAASIPLALAAARADGRLRPGARVLLAAFGSGLTWGATVLEWGTA